MGGLDQTNYQNSLHFNSSKESDVIVRYSELFENVVLVEI